MWLYTRARSRSPSSPAAGTRPWAALQQRRRRWRDLVQQALEAHFPVWLRRITVRQRWGEVLQTILSGIADAARLVALQEQLSKRYGYATLGRLVRAEYKFRQRSLREADALADSRGAGSSSSSSAP